MEPKFLKLTPKKATRQPEKSQDTSHLIGIYQMVRKHLLLK